MGGSEMEIPRCDGANISHWLAFSCGTSTIAELRSNKPHRTPHQMFKFRRPQLDTLTTQAPTIDLPRWGPTGFCHASGHKYKSVSGWDQGLGQCDREDLGKQFCNPSDPAELAL